MTWITWHPTGTPARQDAAGNATLLFLASFVVVLCVALVARLLFVDWRAWFPGAESERSFFKAVQAAVYTFLSHLS